MKTVRIEIVKGSTTFSGGRVFQVHFPLADRIIGAEVTVEKGSQLEVRLTNALFHAKSLDERDGVLKEYRNAKIDFSLTVGDFVSIYAPQAAQKVLEHPLVKADKLDASTGVVIVGKVFEGELDAKDTPTHQWTVVPRITEPVTSFRKYLVLEPQNEPSSYHFAWLDIEGGEHGDIVLEGRKRLGGGLLKLEGEKLSLEFKSAYYGYAPFELVYDAAKAIAQATRDIVPVRTVVVEGNVQYEFSIPAV